MGPTGVGKTELCKALAEAMFRDETAMIRLDMSEFMERHTVSRLVGSPPGYVGYDDGGQLTERVRRKPYSVVLFDEIEKAHPDVWNILLQIMDDGRLTDAQGRTVDFKNAVIVMTSNIGARNLTEARRSFGFTAMAGAQDETRPVAEIREKIMGELRDTFRPEFLNRLDDVIVFHQLTEEQIRGIAEGMLRGLSLRLAERGIALDADEAAMELLAKKGFDPKYGARPLRRLIQSAIEDEAATRMLQGGFSAGDVLLVTVKDGGFALEKKAMREPAAIAS
jgi:ATP-dependent Clp protease ATP-binding subunit ClpC